MNRINSINYHENTIHIPSDVLINICVRLNIFSLLQFEMTHKCSAALQRVWAYKREKDKFAFDWSFLENDEQRDKPSYVLSLALRRYVLEDRQTIARAVKTKTKDPADKVKIRWRHFMERFPIFGAYVNHDIPFLQRVKSRDSAELKKQKQILFEKAAQEKWGGDLLLAGLWEFTTLVVSTDDKMQMVFSYCQKAIESQATLASTLLIRYGIDNLHASECWRKKKDLLQEESKAIAHYLQDNESTQKLIALTLAAAEKKDYEGLHVYMTYAKQFNLNQFWLNRRDYDHLPPIKAELIQQSLTKLGGKFGKEEEIEQDRQYEELLKEYGEQAPAWVLRQAAITKNLKGNCLREANDLYDKAIEIDKDELRRMPFAATDQLHRWVIQSDYSLLEKSKKIDELCGEKIKLLEDAIKIKKKLELWNEADQLYAKRLSFDYSANYDVHVHSSCWHGYIQEAAKLKLKLGQWEEADDLYTKYILIRQGIGVSSRNDIDVLLDVAPLKANLKLWKAADHFYTEILAILGKEISATVLAQAASVKAELEDWLGANRLYEQLQTRKGRLSASVIESMAFTKMQVQDWQEAHRLYQLCIRAYGDRVPDRVIEHAKYAECKCQERPLFSVFCG